MRDPRSCNDHRTARISLQISINVKQQRNQNRRWCANPTQRPARSSIPEFSRLPNPSGPVRRTVRRVPPFGEAVFRHTNQNPQAENHTPRTIFSQGHVFASIISARNPAAGSALKHLRTETRHPDDENGQIPTRDSMFAHPEGTIRRRCPGRSQPGNGKGRSFRHALFGNICRKRISASRTGSCGGLSRGRTSYARRRGCRASGSRLPSARRAGSARAAEAPG